MTEIVPLFSNGIRYHPFYISDSDEGGYGQKSQLKQSRQVVYAGVKYEEDGYPRPTATGRYCEWQHLTVDKSNDESIETFEEYKKTLKLVCESGEPSILNWTVSHDTPNLVYYQVNLLSSSFFAFLILSSFSAIRTTTLDGKSMSSILAQHCTETVSVL